MRCHRKARQQGATRNRIGHSASIGNAARGICRGNPYGNETVGPYGVAVLVAQTASLHCVARRLDLRSDKFPSHGTFVAFTGPGRTRLDRV